MAGPRGCEPHRVPTPRPFDAPLPFERQPPVMKLPAVLLSTLLLAAAAAAGCGKPSDLVPTVEEAKGLVETSQHRLSELGRRGEDLARRVLSLKPDGLNPQPVL